MQNCLVVGLGGFVGSVLRYLVGLIPLNEGVSFPVKTLAVNILGAFAIGLIAAVSLKSTGLDPRLTLFLKVGICGGFTTFSTCALESAQLLQSGKTFCAMAYIVLSVLLCVAAVFLAESLVK